MSIEDIVADIARDAQAAADAATVEQVQAAVTKAVSEALLDIDHRKLSLAAVRRLTGNFNLNTIIQE